MMDYPDELTIYVSGERWLGVPPLVLSCHVIERVSSVGEPCPVCVCPGIPCLAPVPFLASDLWHMRSAPMRFRGGRMVSR